MTKPDKTAKSKKPTLMPPVDRVPDAGPARPATDAKSMLGLPTSPTPPAVSSETVPMLSEPVVAALPAVPAGSSVTTPVEKSVHINVRPKTQKWLKVIAAQEGRTILDVAEEAINDYLIKHGHMRESSDL